ncbi:MAG: GspH/FimT family pseudopilin [Gammaproteobacteria bacterium]
MRGFTLIELMVLTVVVAILATIAIPDFSSSIANNRDTAQVNSLLNSLYLARSDAIKSGVPVTICAGGNPPECSGTSPTWSSGWVVYYATLPPGATTRVIRVYPANPSSTFTSDNGYSFTFQPNGALSPAPAGGVNLTLCDSRGARYAHSLGLMATGRAEAAAQVGYQVNGSTALTCS